MVIIRTIWESTSILVKLRFILILTLWINVSHELFHNITKVSTIISSAFQSIKNIWSSVNWALLVQHLCKSVKSNVGFQLSESLNVFTRRAGFYPRTPHRYMLLTKGERRSTCTTLPEPRTLLNACSLRHQNPKTREFYSIHTICIK